MNLAERLYNEVRRQSKDIVIIGDGMIDVWVHGQLAECQDDCSKFIEHYRHHTAGGAANAAKCLIHWTINYALYTHPENFQPVKTRFVDRDGKIIFRHDDETQLLSVIDYAYIRRNALTHIKYNRCAGVLLSDYDKRVLTPSFLKEVSKLCAENGIPCVADCKRSPEIYEGCILKGNNDYWDKHSIVDGATLVRTRGDCPPILIHTGGFTRYDLLPVKCINHVGAGDCFATFLALALAYGFSLQEAAAVAHSAGRVYVQYPHNRPPRPEEVIEDMNSASPPQTATAVPAPETASTPT